jgi:hypothetical protein
VRWPSTPVGQPFPSYVNHRDHRFLGVLKRLFESIRTIFVSTDTTGYPTIVGGIGETKSMAKPTRRPDPAARLISHILVGAAASATIKRFGSKRQTATTRIVVGLVVAVLHAALDAPLAIKLTQSGV